MDPFVQLTLTAAGIAASVCVALWIEWKASRRERNGRRGDEARAAARAVSHLSSALDLFRPDKHVSLYGDRETYLERETELFRAEGEVRRELVVASDLTHGLLIRALELSYEARGRCWHLWHHADNDLDREERSVIITSIEESHSAVFAVIARCQELLSEAPDDDKTPRPDWREIVARTGA